MKTWFVSAAIGLTLGLITFFALDTMTKAFIAGQFATLQAEVPSEWLLLERLEVKPAVTPNEPNLSFTSTPLHDLYVRMTVSPRNVETGNVLCSGGGPTVLYTSGVAVQIKEDISSLAGLDNCVWPPGVYRIRLTFSMTEPDSQISKVLLVETEDVEVYNMGKE